MEERNLLTSFTPLQIRHAYGFDRVGFENSTHALVAGNGQGQTIAIVDAYDDPNIAGNLATFDSTYGLPAPPSFQKVNQTGGTSYPPPNQGWAHEIALDVEYAHAMAPGANILLVEANDNFLTNLDTAVQYAANHGATAVSMSYTAGEFPGETGLDSVFTHAGVTYLSSTGDGGAPGGYQAFSPNVVAVGGTSLFLDGAGNYQSESGWGGSGGGISQFEPKPAYQNGVVTQSNTRRCIPDASFVADPGTGVIIYDTYGGGGFSTVGGTSVSCPIMAGLTAVVNQGRSYLFGRPSYNGTDFLNALYHLPQSDLVDIVTGNNGFPAGPGYDLVTGLGTPIVDRFVSGMTGAPVYNPLDGSLLVTGGGRGSTDTLTLSQSGSQLVVQVSAGTPVAGSGIPANQTFTFNGNQYSAVTVCSGDWNATVNVQNSTPVTVNLLDHGNAVTVNVGTGHNTVNVWQAAPTTLTTVHGGSTMAINVGRNGTVQDIQGPLILDNPPSFNTVAVDDSADPGNRAAVLDTQVYLSHLYGRISGLAPAFGFIYYRYDDTAAITVKTGTGTETVYVWETGVLGFNAAALTTVEGHSANTTVNVGFGTGVLSGILGGLMITNPSSWTHVNINDESDNANHNGVSAPVMVLTATSLTGLSPGAIRFGPNDLASLTISVGNGTNTYTIVNTQASGVAGGNLTTLNTGAGTDTVNVQQTGGALRINGQGGGGNDVVNLGLNNSLAGIFGAVTIFNGPSYFHVNVNDGADNAPHNVTLSTSGLTGLSQGAINFGAASLNTLTINAGTGSGQTVWTITGSQAFLGTALTFFNTGVGPDYVNVQGMAVPLTINSASGNGAVTITLGDTANTLAGITAPVTVNAAATDALVLNDHNWPLFRTYAITPTTVLWTLGPGVTYSGLGSLAVLGSAGGNTFDLSAGTSPTAAVTLHGGGGANTLLGSNAGNYWAITGADTGFLTGAAYPSPVTFYQVGSLTAGSGGDYFQFADGATLSGTLTGGGSDTLDYSSYSTTVIVDLQTGVATGIGAGPSGPPGAVSGIGTVLGGNGNGSLGAYNLLIGAGGNVLAGGLGRRNLLVAGASASTLYGGDQEDLLIGGTTVYTAAVGVPPLGGEGQPLSQDGPRPPEGGTPTARGYDTVVGLASWQQIAAYWAGPDPFATRVSNLLNGIGVPPLDNTTPTVMGNGGGNTLIGFGELALIYTDGADNVGPPPGPPPGFNPASVMTLISP
jgi:hypothetical protein